MMKIMNIVDIMNVVPVGMSTFCLVSSSNSSDNKTTLK